MLCPIKPDVREFSHGRISGFKRPECDGYKCALWMNRPNATDPDRKGACAYVRQVEVLGGIGAQLEDMPQRVLTAARKETPDA